MAELCFPFDSVAGDREYRASDFADYFADIISNGVTAVGNNLGVTWSSGMTVQVAPGTAWIKGHKYRNTTAKNLTLNVGGELPRIDRVVVRLDIANRIMKALVVAGTPASEPAAPAIANAADFCDICLANIRVPASAAAVSSENITDTRADDTLCGIVRCLVEKIDAEEFFQNSQEAFDLWFTGVKSSAGSITLAKLQAQIDALKDRQVTTVIHTTKTAGGRFYGDMDGDGQVSNTDLITVSRFVAGQAEPTAAQLEAADLDGDGVITDDDRVLLATLQSRMTGGSKVIERIEIRYKDGTKETVWGLTDAPAPSGAA